MKELNADQKAWLDGLQSGNYVRTRNALCKFDGKNRSYCCLGVYVAIKDPSTWFEVISTGIIPIAHHTIVRSSTYLNGRALEQLDLTGKEQEEIAEKNDSLPTTDKTFDAVIPLIKDIWRQKGYDVP